MAAKYLLPCECGAELPVGENQAGARVACACGRQLEIPPLRKLRLLPQEETVDRPAAPGWNLRQALVLGGTLLTFTLLALAAWLWRTTPPPVTFDQQRYAKMVDTNFENATAADLWRHWELDYRTLPSRGFTEFTSPQRDFVQDVIDERRLWRNTLLAAAGVVGVVTLAAFFLIPTPR